MSANALAAERAGISAQKLSAPAAPLPREFLAVALSIQRIL
jgi:hypothetical protein